MTLEILNDCDETLVTIQGSEFMENKARISADNFATLTGFFQGDLNDKMQGLYIRKEDGLFYNFVALQTITEKGFPPTYLLAYQFSVAKNRAEKVNKLLGE